jgi:signal recognition particle receptor subunit beta
VVFFNYTTMQMTAKIVYYGPGLCGKTTNLQFIHQKTAPQSRGEMISLETETDRTLFFDLLPIDVGVIGGMKVRLQLYTVPGQVFYNATRKLVLKGVDGVVFVADSQVEALEPNLQSLANLATNLAEMGLSVEQIPLVMQYNKRDIRNIYPVEKLNEALNPKRFPWFEAAALHGVGVFETLKGISRLAIQSTRKKLAVEAPRVAVTPPPAAAVPGVSPPPSAPPAPVTLEPPRARPASPVAAPDPLSHLLSSATHGEDVHVEFAEEDTGKHQVRAVETKGHLDIQSELERLRAVTGTSKPATVATKDARSTDRRLQEMLVSDRDSRQELRRKNTVDVPARLLKGASGLRLHLVFDGENGEEVVEDALTLKLVGNKKLERLTLHLDLELKGKS